MTVRELIKRLALLPPAAPVYAYEGEGIGLVVLHPDPSHDPTDQLAFIECEPPS